MLVNLTECQMCDGVDGPSEKTLYIGSPTSLIAFISEVPLGELVRKLGSKDKLFEQASYIVGDIPFLILPAFRCLSATDKGEAINKCYVYSYTLLRNKTVAFVPECFCKRHFEKFSGKFQDGLAIKTQDESPVDVLFFYSTLFETLTDKAKLENARTKFERIKQETITSF